jgi:hypothetical protein
MSVTRPSSHSDRVLLLCIRCPNAPRDKPCNGLQIIEVIMGYALRAPVLHRRRARREQHSHPSRRIKEVLKDGRGPAVCSPHRYSLPQVQVLPPCHTSRLRTDAKMADVS